MRIRAIFHTTLLVCMPSISYGSEPSAVTKLLPDTLVSEDTDLSIERGLNFLANGQREDGSFGIRGYRRNVAVCALAGLAFLAHGSTPGRGPYGEQIDRCIDYLLHHTSNSGFIQVPDATSRGPMYGHGFAVLFLSETIGMTARNDLRDRLILAVELIVQSQNDEGGWRYLPRPDDADLSVTVCQVMALRAARNAGITVPKETIDRALHYIKACQNADGGFRYRLERLQTLQSDQSNNEDQARRPSQFARSAAALVALTSAGVYDGPELEAGLEYLDHYRPGQPQSASGSYYPGPYYSVPYYFYGHYYAALAMWHADPTRWNRWYREIRDELVTRQQEDGSWSDSICPEYGTAMSCIILQIPNNCLPILQR